MDEVEESAEDRLIRRSYTSYLSRLKASERMRRTASYWNAALIINSGSGAVASVVLVADSQAYGGRGDVALTCLSLSVLIASLAVAGLDLPGKSRDMFLNYRRIQRLSVEAERVRDGLSDVDLRELESQYQGFLDESENHASSDYFRAFPDERPFPWSGRLQEAGALVPICFLALGIATLVPAVKWLVQGP